MPLAFSDDNGPFRLYFVCVEKAVLHTVGFKLEGHFNAVCR
jgi:hypothetical protein